jgi:hypothetical protein
MEAHTASTEGSTLEAAAMANNRSAAGEPSTAGERSTAQAYAMRVPAERRA